MLRGGTATCVGLGVGTFAVCSVDGPAKAEGARAGSTLTGMVVDDAGADDRRGMRDTRNAEVRPG